LTIHPGIANEDKNRFSSPYELISDNAREFSGDTAKRWHRQHGTRVLSTISVKPRGNGKIEQINGILKGIITRVHLAYPDIPFPDLLQTAVNIHNCISRPSGFS
jgi:hypothetical protein